MGSEELALREDTVNGRWSSGQARQTNKDTGAGWQVWMGRTTHMSTEERKLFPEGGVWEGKQSKQTEGIVHYLMTKRHEGSVKVLSHPGR